MAPPVQARKLIAENRRARFEYSLDDVFEAGLILHGSEVKSLRQGRATIAESYASPEDGGIYLINCHIPEFGNANRFNHEPRRKRKLLLKAKEIGKLFGAVQREGATIIPLKLYFNERGLVKMELAVAKGKKLADKRQTEKDRDWKREQGRIMRDRG
jgi:SsrA-binding protein